MLYLGDHVCVLRPELPPPRMTLAEFLDWADTVDGRWQLRDGVPEAMAPTSDRHGTIQTEVVVRFTNHLRATGQPCRAATGVGVVPRFRSDRTALIPDAAVTCGPPARDRFIPEPVILVEILSPSNETSSRLNALAYTTIPSAQELVLISSTAVGAELYRRQADGNWPAEPDMVGPEATLRLASIAFELPLRELYRDTALFAG
jgi:Uma2 family endonuclease